MYWRNLGSSFTRFLNSFGGGDVLGESTSSSVGRKSLEGRLWFRIWGFGIDMLFLIWTKGRERRHCIQNIDWHLLTDEQRAKAMSWKPKP